MPDDTITRNEFNGFATNVREDFKRFETSLASVSSKLDMLLTGRVDEARMMGEITGAIKSLNEQVGRLESRMATLEARQDESKSGKIKWFGQFMLAIAAACAGYIAHKLK